jgi:Phage major capsid protein E.
MNIFDTATLVQTVPNLIVAQNWLLDRFFTNVVTYDSAEVAIDVEVGARRIAPFCSPLVQGKIVESKRYQTNTFKPAYIKDKRVPDLRKPIKRQFGERIGGELSMEEREMYNIQSEMADQIDMINRRLEWMAAQALQTGQITVQGEGFETTVVDFGRSSDLTVALSGANKWPVTVTAGNTKPTNDLEAWATLVLQKSGVVVRDVVFTAKSWKAFLCDERVIKSGIEMPALSPYNNAVNPGTEVSTGAIYKGRWGQFDLWLYNDWFIDPADDTEKPMVVDGNVLLSGPQLQGTRAFGAIIDPAFAYNAMAYAPKTWLNEDPAQRFLLMQSAPLIIPSRVNASFCATVV